MGPPGQQHHVKMIRRFEVNMMYSIGQGDGDYEILEVDELFIAGDVWRPGCLVAPLPPGVLDHIWNMNTIAPWIGFFWCCMACHQNPQGIMHTSKNHCNRRWEFRKCKWAGKSSH